MSCALQGGPSGHDHVVLTGPAGPEEFWELVWEHRAHVLVSLCPPDTWEKVRGGRKTPNPNPNLRVRRHKEGLRHQMAVRVEASGAGTGVGGGGRGVAGLWAGCVGRELRKPPEQP